MKNLYFISLLLMICGCKKDKQPEFSQYQQQDFKYVIPVEEKHIINKFSDLFDSIRYVKLETTQESLIGEIQSIEIVNDTLLIFDMTNNLLLLFDTNGAFIRKIGVQGKGPGEYSEIRSYAVDRENNNDILILDAGQQMLLRYAFDGTFKDSEKMGIYTRFFACLDGNLVFYKNKDPYFNGEDVYFDLVFVRDQKIVNKLFPFDKEYEHWHTPHRVFYYLNDTLNFLDFWKGEVYSLVDNRVSPRHKLNFNGDLIPIEYTKNAEEYDKYRKDYSKLFIRFVETENYVIFDYVKKGKLCKICFSKTDKKIRNIKPENKDVELATTRALCAYKNNVIVGSIEPQSFLQIMERPGVIEKVIKNKQLLEITRNLTYKDNPIISFAHIQMK